MYFMPLEAILQEHTKDLTKFLRLRGPNLKQKSDIENNSEYCVHNDLHPI